MACFETLWISCSTTFNSMDIRYTDDGGSSNSVLFSTCFRWYSSLKKSSSFSKKEKGNYNKLKIICGLSLWAPRFLFSVQSNPSLCPFISRLTQSRACSAGTTSGCLLCADISPSAFEFCLTFFYLLVCYHKQCRNNNLVHVCTLK